MWRNICIGRDRFQVCIKWKVGKDDIIKFSLETWLDGGALKDQYLQMFVIAQQKDILVRDFLRDLGMRVKGVTGKRTKKSQCLGDQ